MLDARHTSTVIRRADPSLLEAPDASAVVAVKPTRFPQDRIVEASMLVSF
jgi:hypothetical protein